MADRAGREDDGMASKRRCRYCTVQSGSANTRAGVHPPPARGEVPLTTLHSSSSRVGDACDMPESFGPFDVVFCGNLLCRLPDPMLFLNRLPFIVKPGGIVLLVSPYSWLTEYTPQVRTSQWQTSCTPGSLPA